MTEAQEIRGGDSTARAWKNVVIPSEALRRAKVARRAVEGPGAIRETSRKSSRPKDGCVQRFHAIFNMTINIFYNNNCIVHYESYSKN